MAGCKLPDAWTKYAFEWQSPNEKRKIAAYQSRRMALSNSMIHLLPLSGAITLLVLFWSKTWTDNPADNATTLQFVAKLHELLMQASLMTILLHIIRDQALNTYIPLGALSAAARGPQLSYLWSLDFMSAITSSTFNARRRALFALSTSSLLLMTAVVGPSSAVLMIPRSGMPFEQAKESRYTNTPEPDIYPSDLDYSYGLNFSTMSNFNISEVERLSINGKRVFASYTWPDNNRHTRIAKASIVEETSEAGNFSQAIVTVPTVLSRSQLQRLSENLPDDTFGTRSDTIMNSTLAIFTVQPATLVSCTPLISNETENVHFIRKNGTTQFLSTTADIFERMYQPNNSVVQGWVPPLWMPSPEDPSTLIGVFLHMQLHVNETRQRFATCTVTPFWHRTKAWAKAEGTKMEIELPTNEDVSTKKGIRPITIATEGIAVINSAEWFPGLQQSWRSYVDPNVLGMLFVSAISEVPGSTRSLADGFIGASCCQNELVEGYKKQQLDDGITVPLYDFVATSYGYGYGAIDNSIRLSVSVMTAYCIIALLYVTYIITTGHTSVAWDSAIELIILALQSRQPRDLGHVSVGIASMETFRKGVGIRVSTVNDDGSGVPTDKMELVFEDHQEQGEPSSAKLARNRAY